MSLLSKIKSVFVGENFGVTTVQSLTSNSYVKGHSFETTYLSVDQGINVGENINTKSIHAGGVTLNNGNYYVIAGYDSNDPDPADQLITNGNVGVGNLNITGSSGLPGEGDTPGVLYCTGTIKCEVAFNLPIFANPADRDVAISTPEPGTMISLGDPKTKLLTGVQVYDGTTWRTLSWK
jgi:hypothetical protein